MSEPMISLAALFDLQSRFAAVRCAPYTVELTRTVLEWAAAQGMLEPAPNGPSQEQFDRLLAHAGSLEMKLRDMFAAQRTKSMPDIPTGPQVAAEDQDAGDLKTVAAASETDQGPEGASAASQAEKAPVAPDAGGATSKPAGKKPLAPLWTEEEDARAIEMSIAGKTAGEIAEALGRPLDGTKFRLRVKLRDQIAAAKAARQAPVEAAAPVPEPETRAEPPAPPPSAAEPPAAEPPAAEPPAAEPPAAEPPARPLWWLQIEARLNAIGHKAPWTAALDLELMEELALGRKLAEIAADMRIDPASVKYRFFALNGLGRPTLEEQQHLLQVLRARAERVAQAAE